jgi:hypothetical protein
MKIIGDADFEFCDDKVTVTIPKPVWLLVQKWMSRQ